MNDFRQAYQSTVVEEHFDDAYEVELATPWQRIAAALVDWLLVYQVVLMSRDGQTLGKKHMRIRVITTDGETAGFVRHFLLRFCAYYLIVMIISVLLPWEMDMGNGKMQSPVLTIALLICLLMLFFRSKRRRTLQDLLARTLVVKA